MLMLISISIYLLTACMNGLIDPEKSVPTDKIPIGKNSINDDEGDTILSPAEKQACAKCKYIVTSETQNVDGRQLRLNPGDTICLLASIKYRSLRFANLEGAENKPIVITNCSGKVVINSPGEDYSMKVVKSHHFQITGGPNDYGIVLKGGELGLALDYLTTNFEVDHLEIAQVNSVGLMAKTDPSCDSLTTRDHFTMQGLDIHDNFIHTIGHEGMYIGNSFYHNGVETPCGVRLPQSLVDVKIYNNNVEFTGWDGIQVGCVISGAAIHNNNIMFYGTLGEWAQNSGIQIGEGTGGLCYNNFIKEGTGNGIAMLGLGDNLTSDNVIINAGGAGIFCDDRLIKGTAFKFTNNIIIYSGMQGMRIYSTQIPNIITGNLIINPTVNQAASRPNNLDVPASTDYVFKWSNNVKAVESNNKFTRNIAAVRALYEAAFRYKAVQPNSHGPHDKPVSIMEAFLK